MDEARTVIDFYKKELYRIGWRIQYQAKKQRKHECSLTYEPVRPDSAAAQLEQKLLVQQLLAALPSQQARTIIQELYLQGKTEAQAAKALNMSQQAVNKWKQKTLKQLCQMMSS
ncbi:sigma factor-like helix-turn-helix DNA-binding protein [Paenibacillus sp. KS-LC4]|uniref:sigma factor-like helix-turn-helix DNA-binding protein n=1 Tax=Paenibacillus sp. KS-LC4 TaxID=2979727 RepID=UPI0030CA7A81